MTWESQMQAGLPWVS